MVERIAGSHGVAIGFKMSGKLTGEDVALMTTELNTFVAEQRRPIGLLVDLSEMHGASWAARWDEMRFLQSHTDHIARMAVISHDEWQQLGEMVLVASAALQAETLYFQHSEMAHAWHWVKMNKPDDRMPVRVMYPGKGLFQDYTPEYVGL